MTILDDRPHKIKVIYAYQTGSPNRKREYTRCIRAVVDGVDANLARESGRYGIAQHFRWGRNLVGKVRVFTVEVPNSGYDAIVDLSRAVREKYGDDGKNLVFFDPVEATPGGQANSFVAGVFTGFTPTPYNIYVATHELIHTFGISHTYDREDIMYGGYTGGPTFDVKGDRYYNPAPAVGSWLASNPTYNVANSPYLKEVP